MVPTKLTRPEKRVARRTPIPRAPKLRHALDLFSGTGSVAKALQEKGFEVVTVDFNPRNKPSITVDIAVWQYWKVFQPQYFDVIACCPPCTEFSRAMTSRPRDFARADRMVKTSLEIIDYLQPDFWFLENPRHGELRDREYMRDIPYIDVDYCQFSDWGYQKPTRIWGSPMLKKLESKLCDGWCPNMEWMQSVMGPKRVHRSKLGCTADPGKIKPSPIEAGRVPAALIDYLLSATPTLIPKKSHHGDVLPINGGNVPVPKPLLAEPPPPMTTTSALETLPMAADVATSSHQRPEPPPNAASRPTGHVEEATEDADDDYDKTTGPRVSAAGGGGLVCNDNGNDADEFDDMPPLEESDDGEQGSCHGSESHEDESDQGEGDPSPMTKMVHYIKHLQ